MDYTVSEVEAARKVLQTKINDLMREFCEKYQVITSSSSTAYKREKRMDTGELVCSSFDIDTEVRCCL